MIYIWENKKHIFWKASICGLRLRLLTSTEDPLESDMVSKHNVKGRLFQKECRAVKWDSVIILLLVLQLKNYLWVYSWNLCHQYQEYPKDAKIQESLEIADLVSNDQILVIAAENSSINHVWFVHVIDINYCCNHNIPKSQLHLLCNCLEKLNDNKKGVAYENSKTSFLYAKKVFCIYFVEFGPNCNKKEYLFFLSNNSFIEVLNCVQFYDDELINLVVIVFYSFKNYSPTVFCTWQFFGMIYVISYAIFDFFSNCFKICSIFLSMLTLMFKIASIL